MTLCLSLFRTVHNSPMQATLSQLALALVLKKLLSGRTRMGGFSGVMQPLSGLLMPPALQPDNRLYRCCP
ncbi:MAG TPA: hypothetical protein V6D34_08615 [Candidatus Sericytochromatia bacterium]